MSAAVAREALIVAVSDYRDPKLHKLRAPAADADRLAAVLRDPKIGGFDVEVVANPEERDLRRRLAIFFGADRRPDDLLLVHFSCHGVKDQSNQLYLAAVDTQEDLLAATGINATWLNEQIGRCRSKRIVVLLDCCFSGSFPFGARPRAGGAMNVQAHLEGRGRAVITASNAMEYAYEGDQLTGEGQPSVFTDAVVEALATGKADRDGDHRISIQELYDYVFDRVKETQPAQTPNMMSTLAGPLHIAHSRYEPPVDPAELDTQLGALINSPLAGGRLGAVEELARLLRSDDRAIALAARQALERMVDDDSHRVSAAASDALASVAAPVPPDSTRPQLHVLTEADWASGGRQVAQLAHEHPVSDVAFSPDGRYLATGGDSDGTARVWESPSGPQVLQVRHDSVSAVAFSRDGCYLATAGHDGTARVWELPGGNEVMQVNHESVDALGSGLYAVTFSPDGRYLATGGYSDATARVWEFPRGREILRVRHETSPVSESADYGAIYVVTFSPDGRQLATAGDDGTARVWELPGGQEVLQKQGTVVAFSPDGRQLATAGTDTSARVWELPNGQQVTELAHDDAVMSVGFSPDGRYLATASQDKTARVWELAGGRQIVQLAHEDDVVRVAFSPDGRYLVTGGGHRARVWEVSGAQR